MKESDLTKLSRWAVPGWIAFLALVAFCFFQISFTPRCHKIASCKSLQATINDIYSSVSESDTGGQWLTALLVVAAGVPLGFIVYQSYFYFRWNSPISRDGFPGIIAARSQDIKRMVNGLAESDLWKDQPIQNRWRRRWIKSELYQRDHKDRWRYAELLFTEASQFIDSFFAGPSFYDRHRYLHEVMHTIGACIGALYLAFGVYTVVLGHALVESGEGWAFIWYLFFSLLLVALLFFLMSKENSIKQTMELERKKTRGPSPEHPIPVILRGVVLFEPSATYIYLVCLFHFIFNPLINSLPATELRILLITVVIGGAGLFWFLYRSKTWEDPIEQPAKIHFIRIIAIPLILMNLLYWFNENQLLDRDWGFATSFSIFLAANLILFKNRQNAADDMILLENYLLKLYLLGDKRGYPPPGKPLTAIMRARRKKPKPKRSATSGRKVGGKTRA